MTVKDIIRIFGYVVLDKPEHVSLGSVIFVTDKEETYTLIVDKILNNDKIICKLYGGINNGSLF
jgi:hypothetical protein